MFFHPAIYRPAIYRPAIYRPAIYRPIRPIYARLGGVLSRLGLALSVLTGVRRRILARLAGFLGRLDVAGQAAGFLAQVVLLGGKLLGVAAAGRAALDALLILNEVVEAAEVLHHPGPLRLDLLGAVFAQEATPAGP